MQSLLDKMDRLLAELREVAEDYRRMAEEGREELDCYENQQLRERPWQ